MGRLERTASDLEHLVILVLVVDVDQQVLHVVVLFVLDSILSVVLVLQDVGDFLESLLLHFFLSLLLFQIGLFFRGHEFDHKLVRTGLSVQSLGVSRLDHKTGLHCGAVIEGQPGAESDTLVSLGVEVVLELGVGDGVVSLGNAEGDSGGLVDFVETGGLTGHLGRGHEGAVHLDETVFRITKSYHGVRVLEAVTSDSHFGLSGLGTLVGEDSVHGVRGSGNLVHLQSPCVG